MKANNAWRQEQGFTLIELLVVVIIIGVLAAIAIPTFLSQRQRGWQGQLVSDVRNVVLEVEANFVANAGSYPAGQAEFMALGPEISSPTITLSYTTNGSRSEFCVLGTDTRLNAPQNVVNYMNGAGLTTWGACPAFSVP